MKTKRDQDGNYIGNYKGLDFIVLGLNEGWVFCVDFWSSSMCQILTYDSREDGEAAYKTKKACLQVLKEAIDTEIYKTATL